jgi:hypothetical protein
MAVGTSTDYARADHTHGSPTDPVTAHVVAGDPHTQYQKESEKDAASGYAGLSAASKLAGTQQTYGTGVNTACQGNDARLSDARTPTAHATSHQNAGGDEISVAGLSGLLADDQTPLAHNILTAHNGFPGGGTTFLRDDGAFAAAGGAGTDPPEGSYAPGSYTIATGKFRTAVKRQQWTTTQRLTIQGTGRLSLSN